MAVKNDPVQEVFRRHGIDDPTVFLEEHRKEAGVKFSPSVHVLVRGDAFLMLKRLILGTLGNPNVPSIFIFMIHQLIRKVVPTFRVDGL